MSHAATSLVSPGAISLIPVCLCSVMILTLFTELVRAETAVVTNSAPEGSAVSAAGTNELTSAIEVLVEKLGAEDYRDRRLAERKLESLGALAVPQLKAAKKHPDPEVRARVKRLLVVLGAVDDGKGPKTRVYVVREGEDLYSVGLLWNVSIRRLKEINNLQGTRLFPGQRISIPLE